MLATSSTQVVALRTLETDPKRMREMALVEAQLAAHDAEVLAMCSL